MHGDSVKSARTRHTRLKTRTVTLTKSLKGLKPILNWLYESEAVTLPVQPKAIKKIFTLNKI